jgi:SAM-dependent methyltransferase
LQISGSFLRTIIFKYNNGLGQLVKLATSSFDLLVSRFGVMFFADPVAAFRNLHGALTSGARLCFVCWAPLADNPWFQISLEAATAHLEPPEPTPPRSPGPLAFSEPPYVEDMPRAVGFEHLRIERFATTMRSAESLESQSEFLLHFGPAARLIAAQQPSQDIIAAIVKAIADGLTPYADASGIAVPATVFYVSAVKA